MHKFEKLLEKKMKDKKSHLDENSSKAKMSVLSNLKDDMAEMMKDRLHDGLKKVTVASDSPEGIKAGLDKAKQIVGEMSPAKAEKEAHEAEEGEEEGAEHEAAESPEMEEKEHEGDEEEMSEEELDAKIKKLMAKKAKMEKSQKE